MRLTLCVVVVVAFSGSASAQELDAEQLFRLGKKLMKEKNYAEACAAFEASQKAEPNTTTLAQLANCREKNQQLATAWGLYLQVVTETKGDKKQKTLNEEMRSRADSLEPRLSSLAIAVPDDVRAIQGLEILRDGAAVDPTLWGTSLPIDGGDHAIVARAPGFEEWTTTVTVANEGDQQTVDVPMLMAVVVSPIPDDGAPLLHEEPEVPPPATKPGWQAYHRKLTWGFSVNAIHLIEDGDAFWVGARLLLAFRARGTIEPRVGLGVFYAGEPASTVETFTAEACKLFSARSTACAGLLVGYGPFGDFDSTEGFEGAPMYGGVVTPYAYRFGGKNQHELGAFVYLYGAEEGFQFTPMLQYAQYLRSAR